MRTLIHSVAYLDGLSRKATDVGYMIVSGDQIEEIAPGVCPVSHSEFTEVIDGSGRLLMPGFVNTHGHAAMSLLRGYADDMPLQAWLNDMIWPAEAKLTADDIYVGTQLAMLEMLETGTTTFTDMYAFMDQVADAVAESGMRAVLGRGLIGLAPNADKALAESETFIAAYHGAGNGRITTTLAPHAPYTCPPDYLKKVMEVAERLHVSLQIHLAETKQEDADIRAQYGVSPTELLQKTGLFAFPVIASHCVHLSDADIQIFADHQVHVAHNPGSNLKLASGVAPLSKLLAAGVVVGLGTDGAASNNKLDMFEEMRLVALLHKGVELDATSIDAFTALRLATSVGARALYLDPMLGTLQKGAPADFQLIDISGPRYHPRHNLLAHVVYSSHGGDVTDVFVAGKALYRKRQFLTIDVERVMHQATAIARKFGRA